MSPTPSDREGLIERLRKRMNWDDFVAEDFMLAYDEERQLVADELSRAYRENDELRSALLLARSQGRREGIEEAAKVADRYFAGRLVAAAIRNLSTPTSEESK